MSASQRLAPMASPAGRTAWLQLWLAGASLGVAAMPAARLPGGIAPALAAAALLLGVILLAARRLWSQPRAWIVLLAMPLALLGWFGAASGWWSSTADPTQSLTGAEERLRAAWSAELAGLERGARAAVAVDALVPLNRPDERHGLARRDPASGSVLEWRGIASELSAAEWTALRPAGAQARAAVIQRGLSSRLLVAVGAERAVWVAECPLALAPELGDWAPRWPSGVSARVLWFRSGESISAPVEATERDLAAERRGVLLTDASGIPVGRVALLFARSDASAAAPPSTGLWLWSASLAFVAWRWISSAEWWLLWITPLAAVVVERALGSGPFFGSASFGCWVALGVAALFAPSEPRGARRTSIGQSLLVGGVAAAGSVGLSVVLGFEQLGGPAEWPSALFDPRSWWRPAAVLGALLPVAIGARVLMPRRRAARLALLVLGALLAAGAHQWAAGLAIRRHVETKWGAQLASRAEDWLAAMRTTLDDAQRAEADGTLPLGAIDVWWRSPLARAGTICGVWRTGLEGTGEVIEDDLVTGLPRLRYAPRGGERTPRAVRTHALGVSYDLLVMERPRAAGGRWVVAIWDDPSNIAERQRRDPLRGLLASPLPAGSPLRDPNHQPELVRFDPSGALLRSDLDSPPAAPSGQLDAPRWRSNGGDLNAWILDLPDRDGPVAVIVPRPSWLQRVADPLAWALLAVLVVECATMLASGLTAPMRWLRFAAVRTRRLRQNLRAQVGLALVLAGLVPLSGLAFAARALARAQATRQERTEATQRVRFGATLLADLLALRDESAQLNDEPDAVVPIDRETAAWLARTLGDDVFLWHQGRLVATNRDDLVRAGRWPERLRGEIWEQFGSGAQALALERIEPASALEAGQRVVHGTYRESRGSTGVFSLALRRSGVRSADGLAEVDRALLISAALLVGLAAWLARPTARRLTAPLGALRAATTRLASGEFDATIPETGFDETRALGRAFGRMAQSLADQQQSLRARAVAFETLIETMPVAVIAAREDRSIVACNPRAIALLGDLRVAALQPGDPLAAAVGAALADRSSGERGSSAAPVEQHGRHLRVSGIDLPRGGEAGDATRLVIVEDLTDAVRSERLVAWAEMARRIAHEIKNPLTPIALIVDHIRRLAQRNDPSLPEVLDRGLATITRQVAVLRDTSREFSDYARLLVARPEPVELRETLSSWIEPYRLAPPAGVQIATVLPDGELPLRLDPRLLRRAVINLVENALAAVGERGTVTVELAASDRELRIVVADDGPGIAVEKRARLFEPDVTTRETGSGLGLPIVREAIAALGGELEVESREGVGTRFVIRLVRG